MLIIAAILLLTLLPHDALAQAARKPFSTGINEGGGELTGFTGWILSWQIYFKLQLTEAMRAAKLNGSATWGLALLSFGYGGFHAAGPGHGKAVVASYMLANERALKRGMIISFLAAMLQGLVAVALVSIAALIFNATAQRMNEAANLIELASYAGIAVLGLWLLWRKGGAFISALRGGADAHEHHDNAHHDHDHAHHDHDHGHDHAHARDAHVHGPGCDHFHAPDPKTLGEGFSWKGALLTVFAAGSRPCSGAILVLVFALAQSIFLAGIAATFAMSLGTAITTAGLAALAVFAKDFAVKLAGEDSSRGALIVRGFEAAAALGVLVIGVSLLMATLAGARGE